MGKIIKKALPVLAAVAGIALAIPSGGTSLLAAGLGVSGTVAGGIAAGLSISASLLSSTSMPKIPQSETQLSRLQARLDTQAPRKIVLGRTAMPADIRYYEGSGEDERVIEYIIAVAAHKVREISELWIEDELAWSAAGGIAPQFVDYLGVEGYTEGNANNTRAINGGARWGSDDRLTGCAYLYVRVNRLGATENEQSPFANGLPGRVTIVGEGMPMYDPRFDSTVGGSGSMRIANQNTWGPSSGNPIIQSLNVLLGWRINGKLSVGGGLPSKYINLDSVMTAANACDEDIVLSGGGTQPRYRTAGTFSTDDAPMNIVGALLAGCAGDMLDSDGQLSFLIKTNTLAVPAVTFDDHDILSAGRWDPMGGQTNLPNIIAGNFTDPSDKSLYQPVPYPSVKLPSEDGIDRTAQLDFSVVENGPQSERLGKQTLQRMQYPGLFSAEYNMKGMAAKVGRIVWQSYSPRGWVNKPFRVVSQKPSRSGRITLILREEHEVIYSWEAEDSAAVQPAEPVRFDFRNTGPILLAREAAKSADWPRVSDSNGTKPEDNATVGAPNGTPVGDLSAEEVTGALDEAAIALANLATSNSEISAEVDAAQAGIENLIATYGSTAAAAASAANARISADNAGLSATSAGGSATSADSSAAAAADALNLVAKYVSNTVVSTFEQDGTYFVGNNGGSTPNDVTFVDTEWGRAARSNSAASYSSIGSKKRIPVAEGDQIRVRALMSHVSGSPSSAELRIECWTTPTGGSRNGVPRDSSVVSSTTPAWHEKTLTVPAGVTFVNAMVMLNFPSPYAAIQQIHAIEFTNVTATIAAETAAAIAEAQAAVVTADAAAASSNATLAARWAEASAQKNYCIDPDGNNGASFWTWWNTSTGVNIPSVAPAGDRCLQILNNAARQLTHYKYNPLGRTFRIRCWMRPTDAAGFRFCLRQPDGTYIQNIGPATQSDPTKWSQYEVIHTCTVSSPSGWTIATSTVGNGPCDVLIWGLVWEDITDYASVEASVKDIRGAAANSSGQVAAFIRQIVAASGGNPAMFELLAGAGGSKIGLVADQIALGNSVNGIIETVLKIENGQAVLSDAIFRRARVRPIAGSAILHDVELRPRDYLAPDGQTTQYEGGASYGALPEKIVPDLSGLPALAEGHRYDIRATNVTASQFRARAKRISPGPMTERVGSTQATSGSVPTRRVNKPVSDNAYNGEYEFKWTATIVKIDEYNEGAGNLWATYQGTYDLYIYNGSSWIKVGSQTVNGSRFSSSGPNPPTISVAATKVVNSDINAPSGSQVFGVHPATSGSSVSSFNSVSFTTQSGTTETTVTGLIKWSVYPPRP